jgi:hypothetical protein
MRDTPAPPPSAASASASERTHLRLGWGALLAYLTLGLVLEAFHGFKVGWYLDVGSSTRRLMWTLAHAHGTLLALVNLAFAVTADRLPGWQRQPGEGRRWASRCLVWATVTLPLGFFLAGFGIFGGDPGPGILLVIPGGLLLLAGVALAARASLGPSGGAG